MTFRYEAGDYRFDIGRYIVYEDTSNYFKEVEPFRVYGVANDKLKLVSIHKTLAEAKEAIAEYRHRDFA